MTEFHLDSLRYYLWALCHLLKGNNVDSEAIDAFWQGYWSTLIGYYERRLTR